MCSKRVHQVRHTWETPWFTSLFHTDRVIGSDKFACDLREVDQRLQERVALPQHHCGPYGALRGLQPCGQALDALLQFGHCGEPTLLFEAAGGALESEHNTRWGGKKDHLHLPKSVLIYFPGVNDWQVSCPALAICCPFGLPLFSPQADQFWPISSMFLAQKPHKKIGKTVSANMNEVNRHWSLLCIISISVSEHLSNGM